MINQSILIDKYRDLLSSSDGSWDTLGVAIRLARFVEQATPDQCGADAKLGRLVRSMPDGAALVTLNKRWFVDGHATTDTPENALINAGCSDV